MAIHFKTPSLAPKIEDSALVQWLQFIRDDINQLKSAIEQLQKDKYSDMTSFSKVMSRVLKSYIKNGTKSMSDKYCSSCKSENSIVYQEGCQMCLFCGESKCC